MAIESERLLAIFEAKFSSLEKALSKARGDANAAFGDISAAGTRAENVLAKVGSRGSPGISRMSKDFKVLQGQTGNLAAQFNDIGVQLASGTSPFLIAIQQGTQINQVLGQAGAGGAVRALGGAFMSMINPVSLATFAIIGLGGAAVQYFVSMLSDGDAASASLKEQASAIKQVADKWGDALPAVKAYSDELERQKEAADQLAATQATITHLFEGTATAVSDVYSKMATLTGSASDLSAFQDGFTAAQIAMRQFEDALKDGKATTEQYETVNDDLTKLLGIDAVQANTALAASIDMLRANYLNAAKAAGLLVAQQRSLAGLPGNQQLPTLGAVGPVLSSGGKFIDEAQLQNIHAENTKSQFQIEQEKLARKNRPRGGGGGDRGNDFQRQTDQITKRTAALNAQTAAQASVNPLIDDFGLALETARAKQDLLTAAQQAGITITPTIAAQIDILAQNYGEAYAAAQQLAKGQDDVRRSAEQNLRAARGVVQGVIDDFRQGKSAAEVLADAIGRIADRIEDQLLDAIFKVNNAGSGGGGLLGMIFSGISSLFGGGGASSDPWAGLRLPGNAGGTDNWRGGLTKINERGDEIIDLPKGSRVYPHDVSMAMARAGASSPLTISPIFNVDASHSGPGVGAEVEAALKKAMNNLTPAVAKSLREIKLKGIRV